MPVSLRIATRDWDYLTPLLLGDVVSKHITFTIERVGTLIPDLATDPRYDAAEVSFSRYVSLMAAGTDKIVGVPCFLMRGFRHRCIITTEDSPLEHVAQLKGKRIGVTGWRDSGNSWTRTILRRDGVGIDDVFWIAGRLTAEHPIVDRLDGFGRPGRIEAAPGERPMMELLQDGELDAVFTPFMPNGYFGGNSGFRQLIRDFRGAERRYFEEVGYVPGIHVLNVKAAVAQQHPWLTEELTRLFDDSQRLWTAKRRKYAETSPWIIEELLLAARDLSPSWNDSGLDINRKMIEDFLRELHEQGILERPLAVEALFPFQATSRSTAA
jgi:4,5-dihydroxyphthalate decarboxylase